MNKHEATKSSFFEMATVLSAVEDLIIILVVFIRRLQSSVTFITFTSLLSINLEPSYTFYTFRRSSPCDWMWLVLKIFRFITFRNSSQFGGANKDVCVGYNSEQRSADDNRVEVYQVFEDEIPPF